MNTSDSTSSAPDLSAILDFLDTIDVTNVVNMAETAITSSECNQAERVLTVTDSVNDMPQVGSNCEVTVTRVKDQIKRLPSKRKRTRRVGCVPYSTDLRRRKIIELRALRLEVHELSTKLAILQQVTATTPTSTREQQNLAFLARTKRLHSEQLNQELWQKLVNQTKIFLALGDQLITTLGSPQASM